MVAARTNAVAILAAAIGLAAGLIGMIACSLYAIATGAY